MILSRSQLLFLIVALLVSSVPSSRAAEDPPKKTLFLPKSPVAAAYVLAQLSNKELIEAPRSEFVYVALLQRAGLDRKYRLEALDGLAKARTTDPLTELITGLAALDKKGEDSAPVLRELATLLLQKAPADLAKKREDLEKLAADSELPLARQAGYARSSPANLIMQEGIGERVIGAGRSWRTDPGWSAAFPRAGVGAGHGCAHTPGGVCFCFPAGLSFRPWRAGRSPGRAS